VADSNFEAEASGKSVSLRTESSIILKNADPHALRSACENVIRNAIRFTRPGTEVEVVLEIDRSTLEPLGILSVRDHGPGGSGGLAQGNLQPFYRIGGDTQQTDRNGLGLAIASEAIRLHRGTISAANLRPTGLEITIRLPIAFDAASRRYELPQPEQSSTS
jgi:two-component system sensor histidine kinase CpxA